MREHHHGFRSAVLSVVVLALLGRSFGAHAVPVLENSCFVARSTISNSTTSLFIGSSNSSVNYSKAYEIVVESESESEAMTYMAYINPLTVDASRLGTSNVTYTGELVVYSPNSSVSLNSSSIAYISCDNNLDVISDTVIRAVDANPSFILLYSTTDARCDFTRSYELYDGDIGAVFSTLSASVARQLLAAINNSDSLLSADVVVNTTYIMDSITATTTGTATTSSATAKRDVTTVFATQTVGAATTTNPGFSTWTAAPQPTGDTSYTDGTTSKSTSVAMIVLYTIAGIVSGLFLIVIIFGAIRAHRHPERYQIQTNADGTVQRSTRARGIARAVLDSLPLVTVPQPRQHPERRHHSTDSADSEEAGIKMVQIDPATGQEITSVSSDGPKEDGDSNAQESVDTEGSSRPSTSEHSETISLPPEMIFSTDTCPICFEQFEPGQDLRVLPCHHGFHAACVDPWLLNSSSQCPLCRVDLNLRVGEEVPEMPPGLLEDGNAGTLRPHETATEMVHPENGLFFRINRWLDTWNAQLLPAEERHRAMQRIRQDGENRRELLRRQREHLSSDRGQSAWRRFVDRRRHVLQQEQRQQRSQQPEQVQQREQARQPSRPSQQLPQQQPSAAQQTETQSQQTETQPQQVPQLSSQSTTVVDRPSADSTSANTR
ncbi:uncharacterized protein V1518DRAFT_201257 [Limtongia smithiae]|uniref:uncharacterized protein n=1 Tax=Limtongia smithiae TaxID=1125753 RepID=UPI0034CE4227